MFKAKRFSTINCNGIYLGISGNRCNLNLFFVFRGQFRGIQETNIDGSRAVIKFTNNWVTFLDNLFQLKILAQDTRGLYVPTIINSIKINFEEHADISSALSVHEDESIYEAFYYKTIDCIRY